MAEVLFVARVVEDGGIERWRLATEARFLSARQTFAQRRRLSRSESAALVVALVDPSMRDRCWMLVESCPDPAWTEFWLHLVRRALPPYRAEPLFLVAWSAWRQRDRRLAAQAVDAALTADPRHTAATMLRTALRAGVDPSRLRSLADHATRGSTG
jgi:alkylhydroperoxidase/carboxymuconolactone decarboxylase family protein YurZ